MSHSIQLLGPRFAAAAPDPTTSDAKPAETGDKPELTPQEEAANAAQAQLAQEHPAGMVQVERTGLKTGLRLTGGALGLGGAALLGISLLSRGNSGGSRLLAAPLLVGGGLVAAGLGTATLGAELVPPTNRFAAFTGFPSRAEAQQAANKMIGRHTEVFEDVAGKFNIMDKGPVVTSGPTRSSGGGYYTGHYHGDGHGHSHHYYGDGHGHHHSPHYYEPYYPSYPNYFPDYDWYDSYPSTGGGYTSPGDDYYPGSGGGYTSPGDDYPSSGGGYSGGSGSSSGGSTSSGDDYPSSGGGSSYNPPSYNPPSYDPPSYNPPSYNPPSYDPPSYDPPSYGGGYGGGNSSSNGNPSDDDF